MIKPEPKILHGIARAVTQNPEIIIWLRDMYQRELEQLPGKHTNVALFQGRCQVLAEVISFAEKTPDLSAKS
jgi:hypothetical protein